MPTCMSRTAAVYEEEGSWIMVVMKKTAQYLPVGIIGGHVHATEPLVSNVHVPESSEIRNRPSHAVVATR